MSLLILDYQKDKTDYMGTIYDAIQIMQITIPFLLF